jgi:hypothetical protein
MKLANEEMEREEIVKSEKQEDEFSCIYFICTYRIPIPFALGSGDETDLLGIFGGVDLMRDAL